jgi:hypothetical protein
LYLVYRYSTFNSWSNQPLLLVLFVPHFHVLYHLISCRCGLFIFFTCKINYRYINVISLIYIQDCDLWTNVYLDLFLSICMTQDIWQHPYQTLLRFNNPLWSLG